MKITWKNDRKEEQNSLAKMTDRQLEWKGRNGKPVIKMVELIHLVLRNSSKECCMTKKE
jgi:hypothetical protein